MCKRYNARNIHHAIKLSLFHLSDFVTMLVGIGVDGLAYKCYEDVFQSLNLAEAELQQLMIAHFALRKQTRLLLSK